MKVTKSVAESIGGVSTLTTYEVVCDEITLPEGDGVPRLAKAIWAAMVRLEAEQQPKVEMVTHGLDLALERRILEAESEAARTGEPNRYNFSMVRPKPDLRRYGFHPEPLHPNCRCRVEGTFTNVLKPQHKPIRAKARKSHKRGK